MRFRSTGVALVLFSLSAGAPALLRAADRPKDAERPLFTKQVAPLLARYCIGCHGGAKPRARLALDTYRADADAARAHDVWDKVLEHVRAGDMPPAGKPKPTPDEAAAITGWIEATFARADCSGPIDPGRVTIRRLNRVEYNNTIRELVGVHFQPAEDFPADDVGYGFDNIGDVLSMPPILMEKYLAAAEKIVEAAWKDPELRKRILIAEPTPRTRIECARKILSHFAERAYRRPVTAEEVDRLVRFVNVAETQGDDFDKGVQLAVEAVLVSPNFLFRIELDRGKGSDVQPIGDFELAARLSYFLWSSMPDEELFRAARQGDLHKPEVLEAQVRRLLRDPKAHALVENFGDQWLQVRNLKTMTPDPGRFPTFNEGLREAMVKETELFFEAVVREDRSVLDFLDADFTFVNERLAKHYGIAGVQGDEFRRVTLTGGQREQRGGVLTQASVLTVTSNPTRTSPVKRGKWILENILGTPPPPPPPNVPELSEKQEAILSGSLRQRMEQHRSNPNCAACHQRMDPLGFGFENYDAVGAWRAKDGNFAVDPSGTLPGGRSFKGPAELKTLLKGRSEEFTRCLSDRMLTYALGRGLEASDRCAVEAIAHAVAQDRYKFSSLVLAVVKSEPFQKRRGRGKTR